MTKRKTAPFKGGWMNPTIPEQQVRDEIVSFGGLPEECVGRVLAVLRRQVEVWRFDLQRRSADPEPAQWAGLVRAIKVPEQMGFFAFDDVRRKVHVLPAQVLGLLNTVLFARAEVGTVALFERMRDATSPRDGVADPADVALLRGALADMAESLTSVSGRRRQGRRGVGTPFRAVLAELPDTMPVRETRELAAALLRAVDIPAPSGPTQLTALAKARD